MAEVIAIVSGKGGTGKTSLCAGIAQALATSGKTVLCVDCDVGLRNLDIALGISHLGALSFQRGSDLIVSCASGTLMVYYEGMAMDAGKSLTLTRHSVEEGLLRVSVRDSGPGIAPEDLPHVFERFYKADKAHQGKGTGLGLAIAHEIMRLLGEELSVESVYGEGSTFTFTLHTETV